MNMETALSMLRTVVAEYSCKSLSEIVNWSTVRGTRFVNEFGNPMAEISVAPNAAQERFWTVWVTVTDHEENVEVEGWLLFYETGEVYMSANYAVILADGTKTAPAHLFAQSGP